MKKTSFLIIILVVLADQILKFWVKLNMHLYQSINIIGDRIQLFFIENNGMAFGMQFGEIWGKIILTLIRVVAVVIIMILLFKLSKRKNTRIGLVICLSLIVAGAIGNIIDSLFYGMIFSASNSFEPAVLFPEGGGYAPFLQGKVVDMFYCPIIKGMLPDWVPLRGGQYFEFFRPVFNIADSAITVGVAWLLIGYRRFFPSKK
ncbi:MAG: lipoprotein signal peptidase [Bacteroidales bacterium]|nr:lipoprotein signal peptidase [Bacteroidales bacterium]